MVKVISICSHKGLAGKTTSALSVEIAEKFS